jgi:hypothetical protein
MKYVAARAVQAEMMRLSILWDFGDAIAFAIPISGTEDRKPAALLCSMPHRSANPEKAQN